MPLRAPTAPGRLARRVAETTPSHVVLLQDRRVPGAREPIDLLAVAPSGIWVVTAHSGGSRAQVRYARLLIDGRDATRLVHRTTIQAALVAEHLPRGVPVHGVVCTLDAELPLVGSLHLGGIALLRPRRLTRHLTTAGPLRTTDAFVLARELAVRLP